MNPRITRLAGAELRSVRNAHAYIRWLGVMDVIMIPMAPYLCIQHVTKGARTWVTSLIEGTSFSYKSSCDGACCVPMWAVISMLSHGLRVLSLSCSVSERFFSKTFFFRARCITPEIRRE